MKNTLKKKLLVGFSAVSILFGSVFGSLSACAETESDSADFKKYSVVKMTGNYILHKNIKYSNYLNLTNVDTKCALHISMNSYGSVRVKNQDYSHLARNTELYFGKTLEELKENHIEYTDVCEECFPDGIEAE